MDELKGFQGFILAVTLIGLFAGGTVAATAGTLFVIIIAGLFAVAMLLLLAVAVGDGIGPEPLKNRLSTLWDETCMPALARIAGDGNGRLRTKVPLKSQ
jgi:hypothetical protein